MSTLDALFQQRRADGDFGGLGGAVLAPCGTDAEQRRAGTAQNGVDIVEVDMNVGVGGDQVGDALHTCQECGVGGLEGVDDADRAVGQLKQSIVGNHDQRIDLLTQILDAESGGSRTLRSFEAERSSHHGDGQGTLLVRGACDNRAGAGTGAATFAAGHEHHVGALERLLDIGLMILGGLGALLRVGSCAEATARGIVQRDLDVRV